MKRKVTTYLFWHKTLTGKVKGQKQKHTSGIRQVTDQFLMSHKLSHFNTNLQRWSNSLVYIVIIQTTLTLATFLTSVKTNDFHLTGWNKYNFSIGEKKKKKKSIFFFLKQLLEVRLSYQTAVRKLHPRYESCEIALMSKFSQLQLLITLGLGFVIPGTASHLMGDLAQAISLSLSLHSWCSRERYWADT